LEKELLLAMAQYSEIIAKSRFEFEPCYLAQYLFDLAKTFATYYQAVQILNAESKTKEARLVLIYSLKEVLVSGLSLMGMATLERM